MFNLPHLTEFDLDVQSLFFLPSTIEFDKVGMLRQLFVFGNLFQFSLPIRRAFVLFFRLFDRIVFTIFFALNLVNLCEKQNKQTNN